MPIPASAAVERPWEPGVEVEVEAPAVPDSLVNVPADEAVVVPGLELVVELVEVVELCAGAVGVKSLGGAYPGRKLIARPVAVGNTATLFRVTLPVNTAVCAEAVHTQPPSCWVTIG